MSNDKTESISDKLRRWADESKNKQRHIYPTLNAGEDFGINLNQKDFIIECELFHRIADEIDAEKREITERYVRQSWMNPADAIAKFATGEIEWPELKEAIDRYYLPRPLFEDGEPVEVGDSVELNGYTREVTGLSVSCDGKVTMNMKDGSSLTFDGEIPLFKRPKPQVLDADGVPIVVGDKVYLVPGEHCETFPLYGYKAGVEYTVSENESAIHKEDGRICITRGNHTYGYPMPEQVTHREPDSLKKLLNDIRGYLAESPCIDVHVRPWEQRLTALVELDGRDA